MPEMSEYLVDQMTIKMINTVLGNGLGHVYHMDLIKLSHFNKNVYIHIHTNGLAHTRVLVNIHARTCFPLLTSSQVILYAFDA